MIRKTGKYAMLVAMVLAPMATYYAADSNGLVYDDQQRFSTETNPVALAAQDDSNGSLVRVVRRGTPPPMQDPAKLPIAGTVVWITPPGAQNGRAQGIGVHFNSDESGQEARRKIEGLLGGVMQSTRPTHTL